MEQHPVPQHISSYEFKLVGDMTLKQFFQLGGGVFIAFLFYAAALPAFIKWPFILFFSLSGAALAFLPFEERPLSVWIFAFFKAVYSPTRYVWTKGSSEETFPKEIATPAPQFIAPQGEKKAEEYLSQIPQPFDFAQDFDGELSRTGKPEVIPKFETNEANFVQKVTAMFQVSPAEQTTSTASTPTSPSQRVVLQVEEVKDKGEIHIPKIEPIKLETITLPKPQISPVAVQNGPVTPVFSQQLVSPQTQRPEFTPQASPPSSPQIPNTIAGQVLDRESKIIDGAILEIKDSNNLPVRALKSNKAGHFLTVTPLPDGEYVINTEKEGFDFSPVKFIANNSIIPPILIRAQ